MKKDMIFFATDGQGLTSTSANHIANLAKEMIRGIEGDLSSMVLYSTSVALIGTERAEELTKGYTTEDMEKIPGMLHTVAKAKSLIAWLREAIKAKERMLFEVEDMSLEAFAKQEGIEMLPLPVKSKEFTEDEYFASLSLDERNRYYETETLAAVLGKAIHPDGSFAAARAGLDKRIHNPRRVEGDGRDTLIYTYTPTVEPEAVEDLYFRLQKQYREAQSKVNSMKYECDKAVKESQVAESTKYALLYDEYTTQFKQVSNRMATYKQERSKEIGDYRIVIPQSLREIYEEVSHLGKK